MPAPLTAAIRDVELVSAGTWAASTGVTTITRADLEAMLAASRDSVVDHPPIKLGHASGLNDKLGDGEPAYGWVRPTRIIDTRADGKNVPTLVGDLVGMPAKLAEVAPAAYRRRSVEVAWKVRAAGGKTYAAVLTGVALLGVTKPAVKGLADVLALYSGPELEAERTGAVELVEGLDDNPVAVAMLTAARLAGADFAQLDALAASAGARDTATIPTAGVDDAETAPQTTTATGGPTMPAPRTYTDAELRTALRLAADADVDAELTRLAAEPTDPATPTDPAAQPTDPATPPVQPAPGEPASPAQPTGPAAPGVPSPVPGIPVDPNSPDANGGDAQPVQLSAGNYAELSELAAWARTQRRNNVLTEALRSGRIAPAERDLFAAQLERDEAGTTTLLSQLAPRFSTTELGAADAQTVTADAAADKAADDFIAATFSELAPQQ